MHGLSHELARLFSTPGRPETGTSSILRRAAAAHADLLAAAFSAVDLRRVPSLMLIAALLPHEPAVRQRLLCHPVFIEGLHELAPECPAVRTWQQCVVTPPNTSEPPGATAADAHRPGRLLGNAALALLLRSGSAPHGRYWLRSDCFGQVRFPLSDWSLSLRCGGGEGACLSDAPILLRLEGRQALWSTGDQGERPFLQMPCDLLQRLVGRNDGEVRGARLRSLDPLLRSEWQWTAPLCAAGARFLPIHGSRPASHATLCGGILKMLHDVVRGCSPSVHQEFCRYTELVLGFELPGAAGGVVQSFSEPTRPGVMGFNVPFTADDQPLLCPFCFTWLGHEMAHTKMYLAGSIGWREGWSFLHNSGQWTGVLPRYGRALSVRTLFQIPYTHLYEWVLLMDVWNAGQMPLLSANADPLTFGNDLRQEILEAFGLIDTLAELTRRGRAAVCHFRRMFEEADARWQQLCARSAMLAAR